MAAIVRLALVLLSAAAPGLALKAALHASPEESGSKVNTSEDMGLPSLLCIMVVRPSNPEVWLLQVHLDMGSFKACTQWHVYGNATLREQVGSDLGGHMQFISGPMGDRPGQTYMSDFEPPMNADTYRRVWYELHRSRLWQTYDFIAFVDPDSVFFADRIRNLLIPYAPEHAMAVRGRRCSNNEVQFHSTNLAGVQVLSKVGFQNLGNTLENKDYKFSQVRADMLLKAAGQAFHVEEFFEPNLQMSPVDCAAPAIPWRTVYHPVRTPNVMRSCFERLQLLPQPRTHVMHGECIVPTAPVANLHHSK